MPLNLASYDAVLLDLDGTIYHEEHALPGAVELLRRLQRERKLFACLSNSTSSPARIAARLRRMGVELTEESIYTAGAAAVDFVLNQLNHPPRVYDLSTEGVHEMLDGKVRWVENRFARLIGALDAALSLLYEPHERFGPNLKSDQIAPGLGTFLVARAGNKAVGCGALRRLDATTGEVKRMYVEPELRGHGVARQILARLESAASELGIRRLVLETGIHQADALALYSRSGFRKVPCWGEYAGSETSVCFEKHL